MKSRDHHGKSVCHCFLTPL